MARWPLFPVTVVGSWPRPTWLLEAMKRGRADLRTLQDEATLLAVKYQEDAGVDIVSDGEQRRDNLEGSCDPLIPYFARMKIQRFVLEYATPRAGILETLQALPAEVQLGFGAVNLRTIEVESPEQVASRVSQLAELIAPERIYLNLDCGFGTFADRPVGTPDVAFKKLGVLSQAAKLLRTAM
jgi:methionine synthase II (cobalamin-independent)